MKIAQYCGHVVSIEDEQEDGTCRVQSVNGEGIGLSYEGGKGNISKTSMIVDVRLIQDIVDVTEVDEYVKWLASMAEVDALLEADGLLPELSAVIDYSHRCELAFRQWYADKTLNYDQVVVHTNSLNPQNSPLDFTPFSPLNSPHARPAGEILPLVEGRTNENLYPQALAKQGKGRS